MLWLIIILVLVYFLIVRPLTRNRNWNQGFGNPYGNRPPGGGYGGYGGGPFGGAPYGGGFGGAPGSGLGMAVGGFAAGALLTHLLDAGRITPDQYSYFNSLDEQQMLMELQQQNIMQQHEIDQLMSDGRSGDSSYDPGYNNNDNWNNSGDDTGWNSGSDWSNDGGNGDDWV